MFLTIFIAHEDNFQRGSSDTSISSEQNIKNISLCSPSSPAVTTSNPMEVNVTWHSLVDLRYLVDFGPELHSTGKFL